MPVSIAKIMNSVNLPSKQTVIFGFDNGETGISHDFSLPELEDDMILVRNCWISIVSSPYHQPIGVLV